MRHRTSAAFHCRDPFPGATGLRRRWHPSVRTRAAVHLTRARSRDTAPATRRRRLCGRLGRTIAAPQAPRWAEASRPAHPRRKPKMARDHSRPPVSPPALVSRLPRTRGAPDRTVSRTVRDPERRKRAPPHTPGRSSAPENSSASDSPRCRGRRPSPWQVQRRRRGSARRRAGTAARNGPRLCDLRH